MLTFRTIVLSAALGITLGACDQPGNPVPGQNQNPNQNQAYANAPAPYTGQQPGQNPWPGQVNGPGDNPQNPQFPVKPNGPSFVPGTGAAQVGQPLQLRDAPAGTTRLNSQAGHVFRQQLNGNGPVPQQARTYYDVMVKYFDAPPQVLGFQDDPSGRMAQVGFSATKNGAPVMAMLTVTGNGNGPATAFLLMDSPDRFQGSMPAMMAAVQGQ